MRPSATESSTQWDRLLMGLMNASLHIGRTAILSYQSALQVIGNNISSAASPDYVRLAPQLDPLQGPLITGELQPGAGCFP